VLTSSTNSSQRSELHGCGLEAGLEAIEERGALACEPVARGRPTEAECRTGRLESHRGAEEWRVGLRGLNQEEIGPRVFHPERRQAELQQVLALDPPRLLHDGVEPAAPERRHTPLVMSLAALIRSRAEANLPYLRRARSPPQRNPLNSLGILEAGGAVA